MAFGRRIHTQLAPPTTRTTCFFRKVRKGVGTGLPRTTGQPLSLVRAPVTRQKAFTHFRLFLHTTHPVLSFHYVAVFTLHR